MPAQPLSSARQSEAATAHTTQAHTHTHTLAGSESLPTVGAACNVRALVQVQVPVSTQLCSGRAGSGRICTVNMDAAPAAPKPAKRPVDHAGAADAVGVAAQPAKKPKVAGPPLTPAPVPAPADADADADADAPVDVKPPRKKPGPKPGLKRAAMLAAAATARAAAAEDAADDGNEAPPPVVVQRKAVYAKAAPAEAAHDGDAAAHGTRKRAAPFFLRVKCNAPETRMRVHMPGSTTVAGARHRIESQFARLYPALAEQYVYALLAR
jgi:hypothetical protein